MKTKYKQGEQFIRLQFSYIEVSFIIIHVDILAWYDLSFI